MYDTFIFDVDGTLIDTEKAVLGSLQKMLEIDYGRHIELTDLFFVLGIPGTKSLPQLGIADADINRANDRWNFSIYIGDTVYDYECARDAGKDFGLALWGCKNHEKINARYKIEKLQDMIKLLEG